MKKIAEIHAKSISNKDISVAIYQINDEYSGEVLELMPAPNVLEMKEDSSKDMLLPVRTRSGYLRIDSNIDMLRVLQCSSNTERYVVISYDNTTDYMYLNADVYSTEYNNYELPLELPLVSLLAVLDGVYIGAYSFAGKDIVSFAEIVYTCINSVHHNITSVVIPDVLESGDVLRLQVSTAALFKKDKQRTAKELLEDIARTLGVTISEQSGTLVIKDINAITYLTAPFAELQGNYTTHKVITYSYALNYAGMSHKIEIAQGCSKLSVVAELDKMNDIDISVDIDALRLINSYRYNSTNTHINEYLYNATILSDRIRFYAHALEYEEDYNSYASDGERGGEYVEADREPTKSELDQGLFVGGFFSCRDNYKEDKNKINYDYKKAIRLRSRIVNGVSAERADTLAAAITSEDSYTLLKGALLLTADVSAERKDNVSLYSEKYNDALRFALRIGNSYWNGSSWQKIQGEFTRDYSAYLSRYTFTVQCDGTKITNTKTLDMPYTGEGYVMPFDALSGKVELLIYTADTTKVDDVYLANLQLRYVPYQQNYTPILQEKKEQNSTFTDTINNGFRGEKEIKMPFVSNRDDIAAYNILMLEGRAVTKLPYRRGGEYPEQNLLGKLKRIYARSIERISVEVYASTATLIDSYSIDNKTYSAVAREYSYSDDTMIIELTQV